MSADPLAGVLRSADFLFTEQAGKTSYKASLPVKAGTVVLDVLLYPLAQPWAAATDAQFNMGDTINGPQSYFNDLGLRSPDNYFTTYDPTALKPPYPANFGTLQTFGGYSDAGYGPSSSQRSGNAGPGVRYANDDILRMAVTVTGPAASPTGVLLVKIVYFEPIAAFKAAAS